MMRRRGSIRGQRERFASYPPGQRAPEERAGSLASIEGLLINGKDCRLEWRAAHRARIEALRAQEALDNVGKHQGKHIDPAQPLARRYPAGQLFALMAYSPAGAAGKNGHDAAPPRQKEEEVPPCAP